MGEASYNETYGGLEMRGPWSLFFSFNERRCGVTGQAKTLDYFALMINPLCESHWPSQCGLWAAVTPSPAKFEKMWYDNEGVPEDQSDMDLDLVHSRKCEDLGLHRDPSVKAYPGFTNRWGYQHDGMYWSNYFRWSGRGKLPRDGAAPAYCDDGHAGWTIGYWREKYQIDLRQQWAHCIGNLGRDHPTCRKAAWTFSEQWHSGGPMFSTLLEEYAELGHFDGMEKWGVKCRLSMLPTYQPVRTVIPGRYEHMNSERYLKRVNKDPTGNGVYGVWAYGT